MKELPDNSIDLILTDPPYNASNFQRTFEGKNYQPVNQEWDKGFIFDNYISEIKRICKSNGSCLIFCSPHSISDYYKSVEEEFKLQQILHWQKTNPMPSNSNVYTHSIEYILWGTLGKNYWGSTKKYDNGEGYIFNKIKGKTDVFNYPICSGKERTIHPTQKPLSLIVDLLKIHSNKNSIVCDPFIGSGTTAVACLKTERKFIGFEKEKEYYNIALKRIGKFNKSYYEELPEKEKPKQKQLF